MVKSNPMTREISKKGKNRFRIQTKLPAHRIVFAVTQNKQHSSAQPDPIHSRQNKRVCSFNGSGKRETKKNAQQKLLCCSWKQPNKFRQKRTSVVLLSTRMAISVASLTLLRCPKTAFTSAALALATRMIRTTYRARFGHSNRRARPNRSARLCATLERKKTSQQVQTSAFAIMETTTIRFASDWHSPRRSLSFLGQGNTTEGWKRWEQPSQRLNHTTIFARIPAAKGRRRCVIDTFAPRKISKKKKIKNPYRLKQRVFYCSSGS